MPERGVTLLTDTLGQWRDFYSLVGEASATLVALLFVAASVASGVFSADRRAALRVFMSASVVNFSSILAACMVLLAPERSWVVVGLLIIACGMFGLAHSCLAWRDTVRDGLIARIDLEDRVWYVVMPIVGYLCVAGSGVAFALELDYGCLALAVSMALLLAIGVHNAWDITIWSITRRRD